jgi:hypothetical protein
MSCIKISHIAFVEHKSHRREGIEKTYQVAKTPPAVPSVTMYALDTARTAGPAALFIPQDRKPGPPGNAPRVIKKTPPYRRLGSVPHRRIANPVIANNVNAARYIPRRCVLSEINAMRIATTQAQT